MTHTIRRALAALALAQATLACGAPLPATLDETGLYEPGTFTLTEGVRAFRPQFELWSDGSTKERYLSLPEGTQIDTGDMDFWVFPVGTKLWKEFTRDGVRIETRLLEKIDDETWAGASYIWSADGTRADRAPSGGLENVHGTDHDVPPEAECSSCHALAGEWPLGVAALSLAHDESGVTLASLVDEGLLSDPPALPLVWPDDVTKNALGTLFANCGGCHHARAQENADTIPWWREMPPDDMVLRLSVADLARPIEESALYTTTVNVPLERHFGTDDPRIAPGDRDHSGILNRMGRRDEHQMPPLGSELVDDAGLERVGLFVDALGE